MSENEQEVVPVKIAEVADILKYTVGDKYAVHVVITEPPELSFGYCFRTAGKWFLAYGIYSAIGAIIISILREIFK